MTRMFKMVRTIIMIRVIRVIRMIRMANNPVTPNAQAITWALRVRHATIGRLFLTYTHFHPSQIVLIALTVSITLITLIIIF